MKRNHLIVSPVSRQLLFLFIVFTKILPDVFFFFFQAEDGIRDCSRDWSSDVCSSDLVSVYKNLLFMSVEMPNGRLDCGVQGFPPEPPPPAGEDKDKERKPRIPAAQKERFRGVRI